MKNLIITLLIIISTAVSAQTKDAKKIINSVIQKFESVNDYEVNAEVKLDMSFIKVPDTKAKIYFKKPDKFKIDAQGFAMVPKQGMRFSPSELFKGDFTPLYVKTETQGKSKLDVIKIIPTNDSSDVILTTLWIDAVQSVIYKAETTRKKGGTTVIELSYNDFKYGLPSQIKLSFNLGDMQMPANLSNESEHNNANTEKEKKGRGMRNAVSVKGTVIMNYTDYVVNKGIPDSFFEEKAKEKKIKID